MNANAGRTAGRFLKALAVGRGDDVSAEAFVERTGWIDAHIVKGAISASHSGNASAFLAQVGSDFMDYVRGRSAVGRMTGFRRIPFATRIVRQTSGPAASWVAENGLIPLVRAAYTKDDGLPAKKTAAIAVQTLELARSADGETIMLHDLGKACAEAIDRAFLDPTNAGDGATPVAATYNQQSVSASTSPVADFAEAIEALADGGGEVQASYWVMRPELYGVLLMTKVADADGRLAGLPVLTTKVIDKATSGSTIALVDPSGIELAGGVDAQLEVSREGSLSMQDDPAVDETIVSLWQSESAAMRALTPINWRAAAGRAVYIANALY